MFSQYELDVMELLWSEGKGLTKNEIIALSGDKAWNPRTIYHLLNRLIGKNAIEITGAKRYGKTDGRVYSAVMTKEEYDAKNLRRILPEANIPGIVSALVSGEKLDKATLDEIQSVIDRKKRELE